MSGNSADFGGGIFNFESATLTLTNSTVSGNSADFGGGIDNEGGTLTLTNSTVSGNSATRDGGGIYNLGSATLTNSTVSGNSATNDGGGIFNLGSATLTNSIVTKNSDNGTGPDIYKNQGTITDGGHNLIGNNTSVATEFPVGPLVGITGSEVDPLFITDVDMMSLPNSTGDLRLQCGSPAIDAGTQDTTGLILGGMDIAGLARINGARIDIGAHEAIVQLSIDVALLNHDNFPTKVRAITSIQSNGTVDNDESFKFYAGDSIILLDLFEVQLGGTFEAQIEACQNLNP